MEGRRKAEAVLEGASDIVYVCMCVRVYVFYARIQAYEREKVMSPA